MIAVDTSALVSIALRERSASAVLEVLQQTTRAELSLANYLEAVLVLRGRQPGFSLEGLQGWLRELRVEAVEVDRAQINVAAAATMRFGRGSGHPARLNFGDCFAYALAKVRNAPLLFIGDDFTHTDIEPALAQP